MHRRAICGLALIVMFFSGVAARADEIRLKDGTKITGTIVGFENDCFRVETSYGYALVQKDKVADINISTSKKGPEPKPKTSASAVPPSVPTIVPAVANESDSPANVSPEPNALAPERTAAHPRESLSAEKSEAAIPRAKTVAAVPLSSQPPPPPDPPVIRDEIRGNEYVNLTYGFRMYKPPNWDLIPEARKALPDAVAAMGTHDQTTLLVIGREHAKDSLDAHAAATGKALGDVYENYRVISSTHISVAGFPAVEQRSRGTADGRDWSVTLLTFLKGNDAYTLLGMTWADSDLIQIEENVIAKTANSLIFTAQ